MVIHAIWYALHVQVLISGRVLDLHTNVVESSDANPRPFTLFPSREAIYKVVQLRLTQVNLEVAQSSCEIINENLFWVVHVRLRIKHYHKVFPFART